MAGCPERLISHRSAICPAGCTARQSRRTEPSRSQPSLLASQTRLRSVAEGGLGSLPFIARFPEVNPCRRIVIVKISPTPPLETVGKDIAGAGRGAGVPTAGYRPADFERPYPDRPDPLSELSRWPVLQRQCHDRAECLSIYSRRPDVLRRSVEHGHHGCGHGGDRRPLGAALSFLLTRTDVRFRKALEVIVLVPMFISALVLAFGYTVAIGPSGFLSILARDIFGFVPWNIYSLTGIVLVTGLAMSPCLSLCFCSHAQPAIGSGRGGAHQRRTDLACVLRCDRADGASGADLCHRA